jgi:hypothetical protein
MIDSGIVKIDHIRRDDVVVLTAPTEQLQEFVTEHIDKAVSEHPFVLKRKH